MPTTSNCYTHSTPLCKQLADQLQLMKLLGKANELDLLCQLTCICLMAWCDKP